MFLFFQKPTKKGCGEFNYHNENTFSNIFPCGTPAESARAKGRSGGRGGGGGGSCDRGGGDEGIGGGGSHRNGDGSGGGSGSDMMVSPPRRRGRTYGDDGGGGGSDGGGDYGSGSGGGGGHELVGSPLRNMVKVTDGSGRRVGSPVGNRVRIRDRGGDGGGGGMEVLSCPRRREKKGCKGGSGGGSGGGGGGGTGTGGGDGGRSGGVLETARASVQLGLSRKAGRSGGDGKSGMGCGKPVISGSLGRVISSGCGSSPGYSGTGLGSRRGLGVRGTRLGSRDRLQQGRRHDERPFVVNGGMGGGGSYGADRGVGGGGRGGYGDAGVVETEGMVLFWKAPACFAQWTPSMFEVDGVRKNIQMETQGYEKKTKIATPHDSSLWDLKSAGRTNAMRNWFKCVIFQFV